MKNPREKQELLKHIVEGNDVTSISTAEPGEEDVTRYISITRTVKRDTSTATSRGISHIVIAAHDLHDVVIQEFTIDNDILNLISLIEGDSDVLVSVPAEWADLVAAVSAVLFAANPPQP
jgi:hypothetical protein